MTPQQQTETEKLDPVEEMDAYQVRVLRRAQNLFELGFDTDQVIRMGPAQRNFDWHDAERLLREGKTHEQVSWFLEEG